MTAIASFALLERGVETLHASAVVCGGQAVAFLGGPGSGKSTLAALFARQGCSVLTDDLLAVHGRQLLAYPAPPRIKLAPAAARAVGLAPGRLPRVEPGNPKRLWVAHGARRPRPLAALYFLRLSSPSGRVRLTRLPRRAVFRALLGCAYNVALVTRGRLRHQFGLFARLARNVPAWRLQIPRGWRRLGEAAERIERGLTGMTH